MRVDAGRERGPTKLQSRLLRFESGRHLSSQGVAEPAGGRPSPVAWSSRAQGTVSWRTQTYDMHPPVPQAQSPDVTARGAQNCPSTARHVDLATWEVLARRANAYRRLHACAPDANVDHRTESLEMSGRIREARIVHPRCGDRACAEAGHPSDTAAATAASTPLRRSARRTMSVPRSECFPDRHEHPDTTHVHVGSLGGGTRNTLTMKTPIVAEIPSRRTRRQRREARAERARQAAVYVTYRRRTATDDVRVATAMTRWVGR